MGEEEVDAMLLVAAIGLHLQTQSPQARACVENESLPVQFALHAAGVAAIGPGVGTAVEVGFYGRRAGEMRVLGLGQQRACFFTHHRRGERCSQGPTHTPQTHPHRLTPGTQPLGYLVTVDSPAGCASRRKMDRAPGVTPALDGTRPRQGWPDTPSPVDSAPARPREIPCSPPSRSPAVPSACAARTRGASPRSNPTTSRPEATP